MPTPPPPPPPNALPIDSSPESTPIVGVIHLPALPGTPGSRGMSVAEIIDQARYEARLYQDAGLNCLMLENMHDVPYLRGAVGPEIVAAMSAIALAVRSDCHLPLGVQVLAGANKEALAVALAAGLEFIRAEGYAFAHVADEGIMEACAGELLRYRKHIGAEKVQIWADIKKKHASHALTADLGIAETTAAAEFMRADAVVITGPVTGQAPRLEALLAARNSCNLPVFVGSGVNVTNVDQFLPNCDGLIVGSHFKKGGLWSNPIEPSHLTRFMERVRELIAKEAELRADPVAAAG
jgi:membrane complex biogenesis BtpA family protein